MKHFLQSYKKRDKKEEGVFLGNVWKESYQGTSSFPTLEGFYLKRDIKKCIKKIEKTNDKTTKNNG